jgi:hypothetical protein
MPEGAAATAASMREKHETPVVRALIAIDLTFSHGSTLSV